MKFTVKLSAFASYDGLEYDHKPTAEELAEFIDLFISGIQDGYYDVDINCYEEDE